MPENPLELLNNAIHDIASHIHDYTKRPQDFTRKRMLDAESMLKLVLNMQGGSLNAELLDAYPNADERMTASAFSQAKSKLKPEAFEGLFHAYNSTEASHKTLNKTVPYRVFAIDGSDFNPPYSPDSSFVVNYNIDRLKKDGTHTKPYCQVHANLLYDIMDKTYEDCMLQPKTKTDERGAALDMIRRLDSREQSPYIVIMDRGYEGFNMFEAMNRLRNCHYAIRVRAGVGATREIKELPDEELDRDITFALTISKTFYRQYKDEIPCLHYIKKSRRHYKKELSDKSIETRWEFGDNVKTSVRVVKFRINDPDTGREEWEVLITNLNRFEFPLSEMKQLYHLRWGIETSFLQLKYALGGIQFHSKKDDFVKMEIFAHLTMFNAVSRCIGSINVPQNTENKHGCAIEFKMACLVVRKLLRFWNTEPYRNYEGEMLMYRIPLRDGRKDIRKVVKPKTAVWFVYRVA